MDSSSVNGIFCNNLFNNARELDVGRLLSGWLICGGLFVGGFDRLTYSGGYKGVIRGYHRVMWWLSEKILEGYQRVIRGISGGYRVAIRGLSRRYKGVDRGLTGAYQGVS